MYWPGMKHVAGLFDAAENIMWNTFINVVEPIFLCLLFIKYYTVIIINILIVKAIYIAVFCLSVSIDTFNVSLNLF